MAKKKRVYRIVFHNQGKAYELYAKHVAQGAMYGFIEVEGLLFGEKSSLVVAPAEERLKSELAGVSRIHLPMHAGIRIDELEKEGTAKIVPLEGGGNVASIPIYTPGGDGGKG